MGNIGKKKGWPTWTKWVATVLGVFALGGIATNTVASTVASTIANIIGVEWALFRSSAETPVEEPPIPRGCGDDPLQVLVSLTELEGIWNGEKREIPAQHISDYLDMNVNFVEIILNDLGNDLQVESITPWNSEELFWITNAGLDLIYKEGCFGVDE